MLDGWYCRSIANMQANEAATSVSSSTVETSRSREQMKDYSSDSSSDSEQEPNYEAQYLKLKKKLKYLIYENECFQDALRSSQKRLLRVSRDRSYLLDRLLQYEKHDSTTSESDDTESSDDASYNQLDAAKRKKLEATAAQQVISTPSALNKNANAMKRKRAAVQKKPPNTSLSQGNASMLSKASPALGFGLSTSDGHMTPEEVERHLQSRQSYLELLPERAPPTVPTEMFSNDPSLDSESNDVLENSPNVEEWFD
ncbi:INO80 complex subunit E isoform X2 [Papilio machaon]|uniref:INO80 complex subunit E isoform X2 n=1 Tax=Papilio machaon TaxID=76193 RepID=UPI0006EB18AD|nr:INO80 complex subunit E isoform X2 [Papilio machaon]